MRSVTIAEPFDGYPDGPHESSRRVSYAAGQAPEVPDAFADLIIGKGLAREGGETTAAAETLVTARAVGVDQARAAAAALAAAVEGGVPPPAGSAAEPTQHEETHA